jgi:hypothetical protein
MFTALVNFIQYHINETLLALFAPIFKHCSVDSYLFSFCSAILEFAETYGLVTIAFLFTTLYIFYKNSNLGVFKFISKFVRSDNNYRKAVIMELPKRLVNYTKVLAMKIHNFFSITTSIIH